MTTKTRLHRLAAVCLLTAALATVGAFAAPADAEDTYDCSYLEDCEDATAYCDLIGLPPFYGVLGPCSDGNGSMALFVCGRHSDSCRLTS